MFMNPAMAHNAMNDERQHLISGLNKRLSEPKNVFSPGHRIRMNVVPMFLNIFVPWGIFVFVLGSQSFRLMYMNPVTSYCLLGVAILFWIASALFAVSRRKWDPEPTWYIFFSIMVALAIVFGAYWGHFIYENYSFPFYQVSDLKVLRNIDPSKEHGQNVMDAGKFYFAEGTKLDALRTWHFKQRTLYCVAPIVMTDPNTSKVMYPQTQRFDFWAVGKDCCSQTASDFRCGAYMDPLARGGIRNMVDADRAMYRLAIEQASALYGIETSNPIFFEWVLDPVQSVNSWRTYGFMRFLRYCAFAMCFCTFAMAMASCKFSFLGRAESVYGEENFSDPEWKVGNIQTDLSQPGFGHQHIDFYTHERRV